jgi:ATP-dependent protease HslVU (ClpYQ) peptidase subunit
MTVGIAVLCEDSSTVVVASDRMVSTELSGAVVQTDVDCIKFATPSRSIFVLYTGSMRDQTSIMDKAGVISDSSPLELAAKLRAACDDWHEEISERTLRRVGTNLKALGEEVVRQSSGINITTLLLKNYLGEFLITGADKSKTYILTAGEGHVTPQDEPGFVAVGSGSLLAYSALAAWGSHKRQSVEQGVCLAYEAKKLAESAYGVGKKTDIGIVGVGVRGQALR